MDQTKDKKEDSFQTKLDEEKDAAQARRQLDDKKGKNDRVARPSADRHLASADSNTSGAMQPIGSATVVVDKTEFTSGPDDSCVSLGAFASGQKVDVIAQTGNRLCVMADGKVGYIPADHADFTAPAPQADVKPVSVATVTVPVLNVREAPEKDAPILGTLRGSDTVNVYGDSNGFLEIRIGGKPGYIAAEYTDDARFAVQPASRDPEIDRLLEKTALSAEDSACLRQLIAAAPQTERDDLYERFNAKLPERSKESQNSRYDVLAGCLEMLGIRNPNPKLPFAASLSELRRTQKLAETGELQDLGNIANLLGVSYEIRKMPGEIVEDARKFWMQTVRDDLRAGKAVVTLMDNVVMRIAAVREDCVAMEDGQANAAKTVPLDAIGRCGWVMSIR